MLPSVARTDPTYDSDKMWRGQVWININYFLLKHSNKLANLI